MNSAYFVKIRGRVTGVGFRYSTLHFVQQFADIKGYVRNVGEGIVEVLLQGNSYHVEVILEWLKNGPSYSRIDEIKINEIPVDDSRHYFRII